MFKLTNDYACATPRRVAEQADADVQLRDLVRRHCARLERLLKEEMQRKGPAYAQAFGGCVEAHRGRGEAPVASWLYGVTLHLLRDGWAAGVAEQFVWRFLEAFPREFGRPMLILALSGGSYITCSLYLCKPASAPERDISLPADSANWVRQHLH
ncbi:hypothetical protein [Achromobacter deleyi]|uniref:hypothetical protein n=1 Tax=Achromobacter deleyi TaxID=1353891 RepID=UPI001492AEF0|nr:hypothetical protein [Achromobacter deleyi]QVQ28197.1 hypothetical protein HLG70_07165 [Achromobacter deleyi]UIP18389.1 hypothetical protein LYZ39_15290 [Achromobacter deleyi]